MTTLKNIPASQDGLTFIKVLRQSLHNTPYGVSIRGRGPRKPHIGYNGKSHRDLRQDLPMSLATSFTVYIVPKPTFRYERRVTEKVEYVRVPTKWGKQVSV